MQNFLSLLTTVCCELFFFSAKGRIRGKKGWQFCFLSNLSDSCVCVLVLHFRQKLSPVSEILPDTTDHSQEARDTWEIGGFLAVTHHFYHFYP